MIKITYFVHGTTTDNEENIATGWLPGKLSDKGVERAKELGQQAADKKFDVVFCSDLQRAIDTADLAFGTKYEIIHDMRLREADYGDQNGGPSHPLDDAANYIDQPFPNGESYKDVEKRLRSFIDHLRENYQGKHIAIVAHRAPQLALDVILHGKTWADAITQDWRKTKAWQPGWEYTVE